ncbi:ribosomal protection-like ABC-F family protein [Rhodococcus tukisamuensis]|uniref:Macrolide transport system ATP-binding/permease protein n=1 Tax=Rhodococcus tukisamuensis TaxID=168276 RepID=A0A1G7DIB8_9NOCA|nr:ABC-F family ATP-binding cassette domain-containing protein [Rhodococcus tukisamuensis]SDE50836.1 macrolide transport system ATP-binding/permease protein [Rhodococcus tukisamuensis]
MPVSQFSLRSASKRFGDRAVLDGVDLSISPGEKVGVVGDNGSGKSTLLALLAGRTPPDNGEVRVVAPGGVAHAAQSLDLPGGATVRAAIDHILRDLRALEARIRDVEQRLSLAAPDELDALLTEYTSATVLFESMDGYTVDDRVDSGLHALGLPGLDRSRRLGTLSGGEQARLALATSLASNAELLLLDEPTNDIDDTAVEWLEERLLTHRGTVVTVTHDRAFLSRLTPVILEVAERGVRRYGNGYDGYLAAQADERRKRLQQYEEWRSELVRNTRLVAANASRLEAIPRRQEKAGFGHGAFRARGRDHGAMGRIRNAKERIERLTLNAVAPPPDPLRFTPSLSAQVPRSPDGPLVRLHDVRVGSRLTVPELEVPAGGRLLVTGPNGAGKTTLLRVIASEIAPDSGEVCAPAHVGFLRQSGGTWPAAVTLSEAFSARRPGCCPDDAAAELLSLGLFRPDDLHRPLAELSFGQRRRLEVALLATSGAELLLLDEPTNHLSPALVEELEEALDSFAGTVVLVTHDRRMRRRFRGEILPLGGAAGRGVGGPSPRFGLRRS